MANKIEVRKQNKNLVYKTVSKFHKISKLDISFKTGISLPTVAQKLKELENDDLVSLKGEFESTGGRRAQIVEYLPNAKYSIGIDITYGHLTVIVINLAGEIVNGCCRKELIYADNDEYYNIVVNLIWHYLKEENINSSQILGVGISIPSIVDNRTNEITFTNIIAAPEKMAEKFQMRLPFVVRLFNDANSACLSETLGHDDEQTFFYVMLSNSVGGAFVYKNHLMVGDNYRSAEVGHLPIIPNGRMCYCGKRGCLNAYCSAALLSGYKCGGQLELFFQKLKAGDKETKEVFMEYLTHLAIGVKSIRLLFDCDIVLGGYVGMYIDDYIDELQRMVDETILFDTNKKYIRSCTFKQEAAAVGAALNFIIEFNNNV